MVNCCLVVCEFVKRCLIDAVERSRGCLYTTSRPACFQVFLDPDPFGKRTQAAGFHAELARNGHRASRSRAICPRTTEKWSPCGVCKGNNRFALASKSTIGSNKRPGVFDTLLGHGGSDALTGQD